MQAFPGPAYGSETDVAEAGGWRSFPRATGFAGDEWADQFTSTREQTLEFAFKQAGLCEDDKPCGYNRKVCPLLNDHLKKVMPINPVDKEEPQPA